MLMARERRVRKLARSLSGWPRQRCVIQNASLPSQTVWTGTLMELATPERSAGLMPRRRSFSDWTDGLTAAELCESLRCGVAAAPRLLRDRELDPTLRSGRAGRRLPHRAFPQGFIHRGPQGLMVAGSSWVQSTARRAAASGPDPFVHQPE